VKGNIGKANIKEIDKGLFWLFTRTKIWYCCCRYEIFLC